MATVIDSYSESNQNASTSLATGTSGTAYGQCFTGDGQKIVSARFYIAKVSFPTGNAIARIYAMTGTFGVNGTVGTLLGTSDNVNVAGFGAAALQTFTFTGAEQYTTTAGTHYVASCEYTGGNPSNFLNLYYDSTGTHAGTWTFRNDSGVWTPVDASIDFCFYVDGVPAVVDVTVNLTGVGASPAVGTLGFNGSMPLGGVSASPAIGTGTVQFSGDISVSLSGVVAAPAIGTGTVAIEGEVIAPPVSPGGGTGARTGMRIRPTEDKAVYLKGVSANPTVGQVLVLHEMQRVYEKYTTPVPKIIQRPAEMPPGMRRLFKPVEKPVPPAVFVYPVPFPKLRSAVGTVAVKAFYEDIDEETIAMIDLL